MILLVDFQRVFINYFCFEEAISRIFRFARSNFLRAARYLALISSASLSASAAEVACGIDDGTIKGDCAESPTCCCGGDETCGSDRLCSRLVCVVMA